MWCFGLRPTSDSGPLEAPPRAPPVRLGCLMMRFGIERSQWPRHNLGFYIRIFQNQEQADSLWSEQRHALPIPVDPETPETRIFMIEDNTPSSAGEAQSWDIRRRLG